MPIVEDIRRMDREGISIREIARTLGVSRDSVAKYSQMEDLSVQVPARTVRPGRSAWVMTSEVGVFIDQILAADKNAPRKQRHTAKRIYDRLVAEMGFTGSYRRVCDYVRVWKGQHQSAGSSFAELSWAPGAAQVDFGQITCLNAQGLEETLPMLVVSLPFSNARYAQICLGETAECVAHGLQQIYTHLGFVPKKQVFDNATGIGRRVGQQIVESTLFSTFRAHYRFASTFCNPYSGNEKGSVENAVGFLRRNLLTPVPLIVDLEAFNQELLTKCDGLLETDHYRKKTPIKNLLVIDKEESLLLPATKFNVVRFETRKADKEGRIKFANNYYLTDPALHDQEITIGITHDSIEIYDRSGTQVTVLPRCFTHQSSTISEPEPLLALLAGRPGAWKESPAREVMPPTLTMFLDNTDYDDKKRCLKALDRSTTNCGFIPTMKAAAALIERGDPISESNLTLIANRADIIYENNPDVNLGIYDTFTHQETITTNGNANNTDLIGIPA